MIKHALYAVSLCCAAFTVLTGNAVAQTGVSINYDRLNSLEEPLATAIGNVTLSASGVIDAPVRIDLQSMSNDDIDPGFIGNIQVAAATELSNRWNVELRYFAQYNEDFNDNILGFGGLPAPGKFTDNVAGVITGAYGSVIGGNVTNFIGEETRRLRGAGNGALAFDRSYGQLANWGGGYIGQFGPARLSGVVDAQGNFDLGATWSRPLGNKDYRFGLRYTSSEYVGDDGLTQFDSRAITGLAEFIYGSGLYDVGVGYEDLSSDVADLERWYVSSGARYKIGALSASIEGHYGEAGGQREISGALGLQYDIARGMSLNLGLNHADAQVTRNTAVVINRKATQVLTSLRYSY